MRKDKEGDGRLDGLLKTNSSLGTSASMRQCRVDLTNWLKEGWSWEEDRDRGLRAACQWPIEANWISDDGRRTSYDLSGQARRLGSWLIVKKHACVREKKGFLSLGLVLFSTSPSANPKWGQLSEECDRKGVSPSPPFSIRSLFASLQWREMEPSSLGVFLGDRLFIAERGRTKRSLLPQRRGYHWHWQ